MISKLFNKIKLIFTSIMEKVKGNISIVLVLILIQILIIVYLFNNIVYTIESGEAGVLYKRLGTGTITDQVFGEGLYLILPWDRMYVYNVRVQQIGHQFHVLTKNGLKVKLSISVRYYPEYNLIGVLHQKVGPNYVNEIVIPEIESVLRLIVGQLEAEEIYTTKTGLIDKAINEAIEQISRRFVKVDDVIIKEVELPDSVADSIRYKIEQKHMAEAHLFKIEKEKREAERKRIEAGGLKTYNDIVNTSLNDNILQWMGVQATIQLSNSENSKVVVIGSGKRGLPIIGNIALAEEPHGKNFSTDILPSNKVNESQKIAIPVKTEATQNQAEDNKDASLDKSNAYENTNASNQIETIDTNKTKANSETNTGRTYEFKRDPSQDIPREYEQTKENERSEIIDKSGMETDIDRTGMGTDIDRSELTGDNNRSNETK